MFLSAVSGALPGRMFLPLLPSCQVTDIHTNMAAKEYEWEEASYMGSCKHGGVVPYH